MTGLIYMAIIAVWAVVLVPGWLHRHDRRQLGHRNPRVSAFMSRMASRTHVLGIPLPGGSAAPERKVARGRGRKRRERREGRERREPRARLSATGRRRIVLSLILTAVLGVGAAVAAGVLPMLALAVPVTILACFLMLVRTQVSRLRRTRARAARSGLPRAGVAADVPATPVLPMPAPGTWEPRSTPLPRYVTDALEQAALAQAALAEGQRGRSARSRTTMRPSQGVWTAAAMLERAQQERAQQERAQQESQRAERSAGSEARAGIQRQVIGGDDRDEEFLREQAAGRRSAASPMPFRRASNE